MIDQLLGEDNWPEFEQVLRDFAKRHKLSEDKIITTNFNPSNLDDLTTLMMYFAGDLISKEDYSVYPKLTHALSINDVLEIFHNRDTTTTPKVSLNEFIRSFFITTLTNQNDFNKKSYNEISLELHSLRTHQLYLRCRQ